jgi:hypothetical protein
MVGENAGEKRRDMKKKVKKL